MTPVKVSAAMLLLNGVLNVWFLVGLGLDVDGLAAATAITSALNAALLLPGLSRKLGLPRSEARFLHTTARVLIASLLCAAAAAASEAALDGIIGGALALLVAMAVGGVTYVALAQWLGVEDVRTIVARVRGKFSRSRS